MPLGARDRCQLAAIDRAAIRDAAVQLGMAQEESSAEIRRLENLAGKLAREANILLLGAAAVFVFGVWAYWFAGSITVEDQLQDLGARLDSVNDRLHETNGEISVLMAERTEITDGPAQLLRECEAAGGALLDHVDEVSNDLNREWSARAARLRQDAEYPMDIGRDREPVEYPKDPELCVPHGRRTEVWPGTMARLEEDQTYRDLLQTAQASFRELLDRVDTSSESGTRLAELDEKLGELSEQSARLQAGADQLEAQLGLQTELPSNTYLSDASLTALQVNITRFGTLLFVFFLETVLIQHHRYSRRLSAHYETRAIALQLTHSEIDSDRLSSISESLSPAAYDFGNRLSRLFNGYSTERGRRGRARKGLACSSGGRQEPVGATDLNEALIWGRAGHLHDRDAARMGDPPNPKQDEIEAAIARILREDASKHREFLESMFKRTTWGLGILVAGLLAAGSFLFGRSVESVAGTAVASFMEQERVPDQLRERIVDSIGELGPLIDEEVSMAVQRTLESNTGQLDEAIAAKIEEVKAIKPEALLADDLRGPPGEPGPRGARGPAGKPGKPRLDFWTKVIQVREVVERKRFPLRENADFCFPLGHSPDCICSVSAAIPGSDKWGVAVSWRALVTSSGTGYCDCQVGCVRAE